MILTGQFSHAITETYFFHESQLVKSVVYSALAHEWAKKYVMSMSTVAILTKLKLLLLNITPKLPNKFWKAIIKGFCINL